jgi:hypothetical protein
MSSGIILAEILVTANSQGDTAYFPRLYTAIRELKGLLGGKAWLVDSGGAWSEDNRLCQITENRAPYLILDAMGYDLVFADGLSPANLERLQSQMLSKIVPEDYPARLFIQDREFLVMPDRNLSAASIQGNYLKLPLPPQKTIYRLRLDVTNAVILETMLYPVQDDRLPDATITGAVEFVESEARYYQKKQIPKRPLE